MEDNKYVTDKEDRLGHRLNQQIKDLLLYVGFASALISIFGYIAVTVVMIKGFSSAFDIQNQVLFSLVGAGVGLVITFALRYQGVAFAKAEDESKRVMKAYYLQVNKQKKEQDLKTISHFLFWATVKDIVIKGIIIIITTVLVIDIFSRGNGDYSLMWLMTFNILMFTGFGLMAIARAYDHYVEQHIPAIEELTKKLKQRKESQDTIDLANKQLEELPFSDKEGLD